MTSLLKNRLLLISLPFFIFLFSLAAVSIDEKASLFGKYRGLVSTIDCPLPSHSLKEFDHFGFKEYGYFKGGRWCNRKNAPAGYYVYLQPRWYVWRKKGPGKLPAMKIASINGRYEKLIQKIDCPGHRKFYKKFTEYGYHEPWVWCSRKSKPGHYVYVHPTWYVWKKLNDRVPVPPEARKHGNYKYEYSGLLQVLPCPRDEKRYGRFYEQGRYDQGHVYCGMKSRIGYWIYAAPNWYIWKKRKKTTFRMDENYQNLPRE